MSGRVPGLDDGTARRLKRGQLAIDARLDLHGLYREAARDAVCDAVRRAHATGKRCLLIITGKGTVLRGGLAEWLAYDDIAPLVLACQEATPEHGGAGAFYVLIRRRRG